MRFDMDIRDNFASFIDKNSGVSIFVDSFDNKEFEVRIGTVSESKPVGKVIAASTEELNAKLLEIFKSYKGEK